MSLINSKQAKFYTTNSFVYRATNYKIMNRESGEKIKFSINFVIKSKISISQGGDKLKTPKKIKELDDSWFPLKML